MKKFPKLLLLGIAFGIIEASVVIYLRPLFNGNITDFSIQVLPIQSMDGQFHHIIKAEIYREISTLILIFAAAWLAARHWWEGVCYFVFLFAVWDIVYYIWLSIQIGWPKSILDWDILFLVPKAWFAPVIVPIIISSLGIITSIIVVDAFERFKNFKVKSTYIVLILVSFFLWYISFTYQVESIQARLPDQYSWLLFFVGVVLTLTSDLLILLNKKKLQTKGS